MFLKKINRNRPFENVLGSFFKKLENVFECNIVVLDS